MDGFFVLLLLLCGIFIFASFVAQQSQKEKAEALQRAFAMSDIDNMDGIAFEHYVARLLQNEGYTNVEVSKASGDFGVDITASNGGLRYAIQVKRYKGSVSRRAVSDAVGAMGHYSCSAAMVVTNSYLSKQARVFAASVRCEIVDRNTLGEWILRFQGSAPQEQSIHSLNVSINPRPMQAADSAQKVFVPKVPSENSFGPIAENPTCNVPFAILQEIKRYATVQHPKDFSTQAYLVDEHIKAYVALKALQPLTVPEEDFDRIMEQAELDYPHDYSTRLYVVSEQIESYLKLAQLVVNNISSDAFVMIKNEACVNHPYDFSTQLHVIHEQIKSYHSLARLR